MPEKEGAEEKTTKSVVNKKQKQMMGEEGYDVARDMGRVRPSKDKKDATTMPPSKEMKKTRKVNKGPSALELVKKKYKGQIMDVKKEELDLTDVAKRIARMKSGRGLEYGIYTKRGKKDKVTFGQGRERSRVTGDIDDSSSAYDFNQLSGKEKEEYKKIKDTTPKGGIPDWMKQVDKKRKEIQQQPYQKGIKPAFKRAVLTKGKGLRGLASKVVRNPVGTAIAAGVARDSFRMPQLPPMPKVSGGKVGRRTAG
jgi:hypothetical protein